MNALRTLVLAAIVAGAPGARADMIVWDLTGLPGDESSAAATSVPAGMTASDITRGSGLLAVAGLDSINSRNWEDRATPDPDQYYEFSVGGRGSPFSLTSLAYTDNRSVTGPFGVRVSFSLDEFDTSTLLGSYTLLELTNTRHTFNLTGFAALQGATAPVTFRVSAFGAETLVGTYGLGTDPFSANSDLPANVVISTAAATAVPEPGTMVLAALGLPMVTWALRLNKSRPSGREAVRGS